MAEAPPEVRADVFPSFTDDMDPESKHRAWLMTMDYVQKFDIELDKEIYYAGEIISGRVVVITLENIKVKGIRLTLRGKSHTEWKINKAGERRTVKEDEYYIDDKKVLWGKDKHEDGSIPILPRGQHKYPFEFKLPETALPCSFESKVGQIRYYLRIVMDIPYASPPQGIKYFTIIGPHVDCMEDKYLAPKYAEDKYRQCCFCCAKGPVTMRATLERSAYVSGEHIRVKAEIQNGNDEQVWLHCKFVQYVEYFINKGVLGLIKTVNHKIWEHQSESIRPHRTEKHDRLQDVLQVPVAPPTMIDVCNLVQIYYVLKMCVIGENSGELIHIEFPITIGTVPFRIPSSPMPQLEYEIANNRVEGGMYISSEFQLGQVYMGDESTEQDDVILYRPVYACIPHERKEVTNIVKDSKEHSYAQSKQESSVGESRELMIKTNRTNVFCDGETENNGDQNKQNEEEVVMLGEFSATSYSVGITVVGDSCEFIEHDVVTKTKEENEKDVVTGNDKDKVTVNNACEVTENNTGEVSEYLQKEVIETKKVEVIDNNDESENIQEAVKGEVSESFKDEETAN